MASISAVTFNSGSTIDGTLQVGQLAIGSTPQDYANDPGGLKWWSSADLDSGYIIAHVNPNANQPNSQGITGVKVGFWRTQFTDSDFISWAEYIAKRDHTPQTFSTATEANIWLFANGYWTSYSNEPIPTITLTPTSTITPTPTPSSTPGDDSLVDPIITENDEYIDLGNDEYLMFVDPVEPSPTPTTTPTQTVTPTTTPTQTVTPTPTITQTSTPTQTVTLTTTPTSSEVPVTPTPTFTPTQSTVSYNIQLPNSTNVYGNFSNDLTAACNSVECLTSPSSCSWNSGNSVYSTKPDYNSLQVGDIFYTTSSLTTVDTSINGYRILFTTPNFSLVNIVNGVIDSFVSCTTPTPTASVTTTPSVTPTITPTSSEVAVTPTPTPSTSPVPVTGYGYNLVVLPYNVPTSGNTIFPTFATPGDMSGTTNPNTFTTNGVYWNTIDNLGFDRSNYFSGMTGVSVTAYFTQNGDTAIYSGSTTAFTFDGPPGQQSFNYNPNIVPGQLVLIQSASTNFVTGQTVYISYTVNGAGVTPTPTATSVTPTPTPTSGYTSDGWLFYSPDNQPVLSPPSNNGNTTFIYGSTGTYNPNYTGGTFNLYFNTGTTIGTSYLSQFSTLNDSGGSITISQGSSVAIYSGNSLNYQINSGFLVLSVSDSAQMIQSASTAFVSGVTINVVVN
jgi:hypothetical protein